MQRSKEFFTQDFKTKVIYITKHIPHGKVTTYGTVSTLAGVPRAARMVGGILHFYSDEFNLPWQRVINRQGFISTRCENHLRDEQKELLQMEGIEVNDDFMINLEKYGWWG